jgi:hypothetical protein
VAVVEVAEPQPKVVLVRLVEETAEQVELHPRQQLSTADRVVVVAQTPPSMVLPEVKALS